MPILPFINDSEKNIIDLICQAKEAGVKYIIPFMGLTLREGSREYFYKQLDRSFPGVKEQYISRFGDSYNCNSPNANELYQILYKLLKKWTIPDKMEFYKPARVEQLKLF
jgi:DNA repair photolyase